jgi:exopolyphosphatase/guanosine-5'-triphosphate,3'-diphosphate pyrophosphatase
VTSRFAALDCGSNSTRLLIADERGKSLLRTMRITRLSEGVDTAGTLTSVAMKRCFAVLNEFRELMDEAGVTSGLLVATSAVRDASNGNEFLAEAQRITGVTTSILSGDEEAAFSYAGATNGLGATDVVPMIVDIGGGSTELAVRLGTTLSSVSMQLGCVRVTERTLGRGVVGEPSRSNTIAMIESELDRAFARVPIFAELVGNVQLIGLAGTVATLAQLQSGLVHYERDAVHHQRLTRQTVQHWRDVLGAEPPEVRLSRPGMVAGREDVLVAGLYILDAIMGRFGVNELLTSEDDILDGIITSLLATRSL